MLYFFNNFEVLCNYVRQQRVGGGARVGTCPAPWKMKGKMYSVWGAYFLLLGDPFLNVGALFLLKSLYVFFPYGGLFPTYGGPFLSPLGGGAFCLCGGPFWARPPYKNFFRHLCVELFKKKRLPGQFTQFT